jgi:putative ABC transport system permease protein
MEADPRLRLAVKTEREYFAEQASRTSELIHRLGWPLAFLLSFGALAGAVNAINAVTSVRGAQTATLRALGFERSAIFLGAFAESCLVAVGAGLIGVLVAYAIFSGLRTTLGSGVTEVALSLEFTRPLLLQALLLAAGIGAIGGMLPAWSAARRPISSDLRG